MAGLVVQRHQDLCLHTCTHIHTHTHILTHTHTHGMSFLCSKGIKDFISRHACTTNYSIYVYVMSLCLCVRMYTHMHTCIHTCIHVYTHIHQSIHTQSQCIYSHTQYTHTHREVSRKIFEFVARCFGARVGWEGVGSPFGENDDGITHQVCKFRCVCVCVSLFVCVCCVYVCIGAFGENDDGITHQVCNFRNVCICTHTYIHTYRITHQVYIVCVCICMYVYVCMHVYYTSVFCFRKKDK
jgi:hypothetical protein